MNVDKATKALESIDPKDLEPYREYFETITPRTEEDIFRRGLFAICSVHTTWQYNLNLYSLLYDLDWLDNKTKLAHYVYESRAGLTLGRTKSLWEFNQKYWADPSWYLKKEDETWGELRDRIQGRTMGLGFSKSAFFVELCYLNSARVLVTDTHILQEFGLKGNSSPSRKTYGYVEAHWIYECDRLGLAPAAARWALWDRKQGHPGDPTYWSFCLEGGKPGLVLPRQLELFSWAETSGIDAAMVPA